MAALRGAWRATTMSAGAAGSRGSAQIRLVTSRAVVVSSACCPTTVSARRLRRGLATSAATLAVEQPTGKTTGVRAASTSNSANAQNATDKPTILVTGCLGQLGAPLIHELHARYGPGSVIATDVRRRPAQLDIGGARYAYADVTDVKDLERLVVEHNVTCVVHFGALLSAIGERLPQKALDINLKGVHNVLELARMHQLRVFIPSTIGAFGPSTPRDPAPDVTIMRPTTIYGITKLHMELLGEWYANKYGVDFRSLRYPGIVSALTAPGGGTTDYSVEMFRAALETGHYECFLRDDSGLPMMYLPDCIRGTVDLIQAPADRLKQRVYNMGAMSFTPAELMEAINRAGVPCTVSYAPDFRQAIADSWPMRLDDSSARQDWGWKEHYGLNEMARDIIRQLREAGFGRPRQQVAQTARSARAA